MSHKSLTRRGYVLKKKHMTEKEEKQILRDLTFQPIIMQAFRDLARPKKFYTFLESEKRYYLPRHYGEETFGPPEQNLLENTGTKVDFKFYWDLLPHQINVWNAIEDHFFTKGKTGGILSLPCGMGKCHGKDTKIMMHNGTFKMVQDIEIGDQLMGDDSSPRNVLSLARGREQMYRIVPKKGDSYIVNESHILSLKSSTNHSKKMYKGAIIDISVKDWLKFHSRGSPLRCYRVPLNFPSKKVDFDPYLLGHWLGIDDKKGDFFTSNGYNLIDNKHIPMVYKCNSREIRLQVLAGLIDSDGSLSDDRKGYDLISKYEILLDDIIFLARSLGFAAYKEVCQKTETDTRATNLYYRTNIHGPGLEDIPVKIGYKKVTEELEQIKDVLVTGFRVEKLNIDDYYGFTLDGNGRYLLGDFQVTHNTALSIKLASQIGYKTIVVVNKEFLMKQWIKAIESCTNARVGIIQRNKVDIEDKDIVVAMLHSLAMKDYPEHIFQEMNTVIFDECHHIASETFSKALPKVATNYTIGLSATPVRRDGLTQVFLNYLGPIFYRETRAGSNRVYVKFFDIKSTSSHFDLEMMEFTGTKDTGKMTTNITKFDAINHLILEICRILVQDADRPRKVLVLGARREQLEWLNESWNELSYQNYKKKFATGGLYYGNQKMNKKMYWEMLEKSAECDIIWGTNDIAKEGLDIPDLNTLLLLSGGQDIEQAVGRILRKFHEKTPPTVIDLVYKCGNFPSHARKRKEFYDDQTYICHKHTIEVTDDENSVYRQSDQITEFLHDYPHPGGVGVLKPGKRKQQDDVPLANHPEELKSIPAEDWNKVSSIKNITSTKNTNSKSKSKSSVKIPVEIMIRPTTKDNRGKINDFLLDPDEQEQLETHIPNEDNSLLLIDSDDDDIQQSKKPIKEKKSTICTKVEPIIYETLISSKPNLSKIKSKNVITLSEYTPKKEKKITIDNPLIYRHKKNKPIVLED